MCHCVAKHQRDNKSELSLYSVGDSVGGMAPREGMRQVTGSSHCRGAANRRLLSHVHLGGQEE